MPNEFIHEGEITDYTPGSDIAAGEVIKQEKLFGVAPLPIPVGKTGALQIKGSFDIDKTGGAINSGDLLFWDDTNKEVTLSIDNGNNEFIGLGALPALAADLTARVLLSHRQVSVDIGYVPPALDLLGWWSFRRIDSLDVSLDNDPIGNAEDLSINTNDASQTTTAQKPILKLNIQNNNSVARVDGVDDFLDMGDKSDFEVDDFSIFVVVSRTAPLNNDVFVALQHLTIGGSIQGFGFDINSGNLRCFIAVTNSTWHITNSTGISFGADIYYLFSVIKTGSIVSLYRNGELVAQTMDAPLSVRYGANKNSMLFVAQRTVKISHFKGDAGEVLVYGAGKTLAQQDEIYDGLGEEWAVVVRGDSLATPEGDAIVTDFGLRIRVA